MDLLISSDLKVDGSCVLIVFLLAVKKKKKHLTEERKDLSWLTGSEVPVHPDGEGMTASTVVHIGGRMSWLLFTSWI